MRPKNSKFPCAVSSSYRARLCGTTPSDARTSGRIGSVLPSRRTVPLSGLTSPQRTPMVVVLPAPLGPSRPNISPRPTSNPTPSTATTSPNRLQSFSTAMVAIRCTPLRCHIFPDRKDTTTLVSRGRSPDIQNLSEQAVVRLAARTNLFVRGPIERSSPVRRRRQMSLPVPSADSAGGGSRSWRSQNGSLRWLFDSLSEMRRHNFAATLLREQKMSTYSGWPFMFMRWYSNSQ